MISNNSAKTNPNIDQVRDEVQVWFEKNKLPTNQYWHMIWMLLTACDDFVRNFSAVSSQSKEKNLILASYYHRLTMPYSLRHALSLINKNLIRTRSELGELKVVDYKMKITINTFANYRVRAG